MRRITTLDFETDPFAYGVRVKPFLAGYYDGENFQSWWNEKCVTQFLSFMDGQQASYVYAHNGGKFDFLLGLLEHAQGPVCIINGRIVECTIGRHIYRDSYSILPIPLKAYDKDDIDYNKLHRHRRENHREEILKYLRKDCVALHQLVSAFIDELGNKLTIASAALKQLEKYHDFERGDASFDDKFRKAYYYGGRVQCFKTGIVKQSLKIYDVNSMYPFVMKNFLHPVGTATHISKRIEEDTCFITAEGRNMGAFPQRLKDGSLSFEIKSGIFSVTIHEWNAALDTGTFKPLRIIQTIGIKNRTSFSEFVDHFYDARQSAKSHGDRVRDIFYKLVLNSSYGKFAQNCKNFSEYRIEPINIRLADPCPLCKGKGDNAKCEWCEGYGTAWIKAHIREGKYCIWKQPTIRKAYYNIATGASITGAARAMLLRGLSNAKRPIYCDTDSIICESLKGDFSETELGAWKCEGEGDIAAIAGKKLYAIFTGKKPKVKPGDTEPKKTSHGWCIKKAHKGARLEPSQIIRIARGQVIETRSETPSFNLAGDVKFTRRRLKRTAF